jgi:hypothetical protein
MTDVDSIRWMASEHDLEFVDLEHYGVDPAAGEILPVELARRHHMVAVKRRFGTPVIATSHPDDLLAKDSVRASIGRDFISVVASPDQIDAYIERLFGAEPGHDDVDDVAMVPLTSQPEEDSRPAEGRADSSSVEVSGTTEANADPYVDLVFDAPDPDAPEAEGAGAEVPGPIATGEGKRSKEDRNRKKSETLDTSDWQELSVDAPTTASAAGPDEVPQDQGSTADGGGADPFEPAPTTFDAEVDESSNSMDVHLEEIIPEPADSGDSNLESGGLEPATSILPSFGSDWTEPDAFMTPIPLDTGVDQLAELALSLQSEERSAGGDEAVIAADLVDEAVATYQEQQGDELRLAAEPVETPNGTAMFPPLAKALVDGERVPIETMEAVLEEHYHHRPDASPASSLRKSLVTEADLMWGMAQRDGSRVRRSRHGGRSICQRSRDHAARGNGASPQRRWSSTCKTTASPVVAASNPTDVFAMDDLRTIIGTKFHHGRGGHPFPDQRVHR